MSIIKKVKVNHNLTCLIILLFCKAIILISLVKMQTTGLSKPVLIIKIL